MSRQHIDIGSTPNDGTGDVPRIAWDKANDNFIELYTMFDDWPGNFDYWPLGGPADLTSAVTIDGNNFDLIFGSPNPLDEFDVFTDNAIHLHNDDGSFHTHLLLNNTAGTFTYDDGVKTSGIGVSTIFAQIFQGDATDTSAVTVVTNEITLSSDDGVDTSSLSLAPSGGVSIDATGFEVNAGDVFMFADGQYQVGSIDGVSDSDYDGLAAVNLGVSSTNINIGHSASPVTVPVVSAAAGQTYFVTVDDTGLLSSQADTTLSTTVSISSAEILSLNSSPKTLIAAPGAGKFIQIISISATLDFVSAAYASNVDLFFRYASGGPAINSGSMNIAQGADEYFRFGLTTDETGTAVSSFVNQPVVAQVNTGDPTTGDGTIKVYITYRIVTL